MEIFFGGKQKIQIAKWTNPKHFSLFFGKIQLNEMALEKRCICCIALMYKNLIGLGQTVQSF